MSPIPGIVASQITGHLSTNSYFSIATQIATANQTTVTFTSIPQTYKHLQVVAYNGSSSITSAGYMYFNNDTTATNYYSNYYYVAGQSGTNNVNSSGGAAPYGPNFAGGTLTSFPGIMIVNIPDYTSTTKAKSALEFDGVISSDTGYSGYMNHSGIVYTANTNAINRLDFTAPSGGWKVDTHFALYGLA